MTEHAIKQFIKRFYNVYHKLLNRNDAINHIRNRFINSKSEKISDELRNRRRKYEKNGKNTVYLVDCGWRFVVDINNKIISTIEIAGKNRKGNKNKIEHSKTDDPDSSG